MSSSMQVPCWVPMRSITKKRKEPQPFFDKLYSCGRVVVEDNVEIGAACTIDKGVSGDTVIGKGSKLDNHIHIGAAWCWANAPS